MPGETAGSSLAVRLRYEAASEPVATWDGLDPPFRKTDRRRPIPLVSNQFRVLPARGFKRRANARGGPPRGNLNEHATAFQIPDIFAEPGFPKSA